jgi:DNA-binding NtrC family response regulator
MSLAKVLLVDDEVPFVETFTKRLTKRDLEIVAANNGRAALKQLESLTDIEVVILDVKMPGMDGIETLRAIRQTCPLVEVIMLTGHATVESTIDGTKLGAFDYLMKPCRMHGLATRVTEAGAKKRQHEEKIIQAGLREITGRCA